MYSVLLGLHTASPLHQCFSKTCGQLAVRHAGAVHSHDSHSTDSRKLAHTSFPDPRFPRAGLVLGGLGQHKSALLVGGGGSLNAPNSDSTVKIEF